MFQVVENEKTGKWHVFGENGKALCSAVVNSDYSKVYSTSDAILGQQPFCAECVERMEVIDEATGEGIYSDELYLAIIQEEEDDETEDDDGSLEDDYGEESSPDQTCEDAWDGFHIDEEDDEHLDDEEVEEDEIDEDAY